MSTPKPITQAERLTRIETILEEKVVPLLDRLNHKVDDDVADLARLKHSGAGILVGTSIAFTALGVFLHQPIKSIIALFQ